MAGKLKSLIGRLLFGDHNELEVGVPGFLFNEDSQGVNFYLHQAAFQQLAQGHGTSTALIQRVVLQMLEEQGMAERLPNGFQVPSSVIAGLDDEQAELLDLPAFFSGNFSTHISGHTKKSSFRLQLQANLEGQVRPFQRRGPFLYLGTETRYRLNTAELMGIEAVERHGMLSAEERNEAANLQVMALLQMAERSGMRVDLKHFDRLDVVIPDAVGVSAIRLPDGSLELCPSLGAGILPKELEKRLGQLSLESKEGVLRVENQIVLVKPEQMEGIKEILGNKRIPADKVQDFIQAPTAFLDAALVNLDLGFSIRVLGVGKLQHMDFGSLDETRRDWFANGGQAVPPEVLNKLITSQEDLGTFTKKREAAEQQGAEVVEFGGELIDISDRVLVDQVIEDITQNISKNAATEKVSDDEGKESRTTISLLLKDAEEVSRGLLEQLQNAPAVAPPDWKHYVRHPFPHQKEGIAWMLNLIEQAQQADHQDLYRVQGGLLADDMGLGKTYMTLVALGEYLIRQKIAGKTQKPLLVVAPLGLLENWEQEIANTFAQIPFKDIKVLQAGRDLSEFRIKGAERETVQRASALNEQGEMDSSAIRYALNIGPNAGTHRLDMDRRLVLTTYQTLRDYQLSLCMIDWGVVVFDEAQNIKNPNTLQARAAKGLKADFKLLATGTPVENSLGDFWCLMDTAQPGLLGGWRAFREKWIRPMTNTADVEADALRLKLGRELRDAVGGYMLRRIKEDQLDGLPAKTIRGGVASGKAGQMIHVAELARMMRGPQLAAYDAVLKDYRQRRATDDARGQALAALQQLRNVSLHPRLKKAAQLISINSDQAKAFMGESAKLEVLLELLDQIRQKDEKVILFMVTKQLQRLLKIWLDQIYGLSIHIINGDTAAVQKKHDELTRKRMIEQFESVTGFNIIIMSPVAAGVGLTVVAANHVVHLERHWNPAKEAQATDRVYRIGQKKDVFIHLPTVLHPEHDSFDVHLHRLLDGKLMLKDAVVTPDQVSEEDVIRSMGL